MARVRGERDADMKPVEVQSAREKAEALLAFRDAYAPDKKRFHERALLVDNGGRGSEQKAVVFTADDLSALLQDLANEEQKVREAHDAFLAVTVLAPEVAFNPMNLSGTAAGIVLSVRQRHAEAVERAERAVIDWMWTEDPLCDNADETWAAWLASEAKARLT